MLLQSGRSASRLRLLKLTFGVALTKAFGDRITSIKVTRLITHFNLDKLSYDSVPLRSDFSRGPSPSSMLRLKSILRFLGTMKPQEVDGASSTVEFSNWIMAFKSKFTIGITTMTWKVLHLCLRSLDRFVKFTSD